MNKIIKYLESIGFKVEYDRTYTMRHYNGRSFYNDGTYEVSVYKIVGTEYSVQHKCSGRPLYYLYNNKKCLIDTGRFSQRDFIEVLKEVLKDESVNKRLERTK